MSNLSADDVNKKVMAIIADSLCIEEDEVKLESNLISDLGAESIDFLDIVFKLESEFGIKIPQREFENLARGGIKPEEFEVDGILQEKGVARLKELLPEIDPVKFKAGMPLRELPSLFTTKVFCSIVERKLNGEFEEMAKKYGGSTGSDS